MKIKADWIESGAGREILEMLNSSGFQAFYVGGCVRDALLGREVGDIDISTDAHPEQVSQAAQQNGFHVVPTGLEHGTVTVLIKGVPFEVTTFRRDVATDGRRAVVAFATDILDDAKRRDFTMNALYCDVLGNVIDPLDGLDDLKARKVRFIDDADARIREDYLRTLRFFRFNAWIGDEKGGMDTDALSAIADNLDGLDRLSRERVGTEILKLLAAPDPSFSVSTMEKTGVLARILPGTNTKFLAPLVHFEGGAKPNPIRRLVALGGDNPTDKLRLSRADAKQWQTLMTSIEAGTTMRALAYRHGVEIALSSAMLAAAFSGAAPSNIDKVELAKDAARVFPIQAADLIPEFEGKALGQKLKELEDIWIKSGFTRDKDSLLGS